jgi:hypothetical protein
MGNQILFTLVKRMGRLNTAENTRLNQMAACAGAAMFQSHAAFSQDYGKASGHAALSRVCCDTRRSFGMSDGKRACLQVWRE